MPLVTIGTAGGPRRWCYHPASTGDDPPPGPVTATPVDATHTEHSAASPDLATPPAANGAPVFLRQRLQGLWRSTRRVIRVVRGLFPLTWPGALVTLVAVVSFLSLGVDRLDLVVLATAGLAVLSLVLLVVLVSICSVVVHLRVRRAPSPVALLLESGGAQPTGWVLPVPRWLPLVEVEWTWDRPPEVIVVAQPARGGAREQVTPSRRGEWPGLRRRFLVRDVTGFSAVTWTVATPTHVRVEPSRGALDQLTLLDTLAGGEELSEPRGTPFGDRVDMRQYTHGDSPRLILWKVYARTRKLLVRIPERAVTARPRACAYLVAGDGDEATAGLARVLVERGVLGDNWWFGADGTQRVASDTRGALDVLVLSGLAGDRGCSDTTLAARPTDPSETRLDGFLNRAEQAGFSISLLFLPARPGPWTDAAVAAVTHSRMRVQLYTALDNADLRPARHHRLDRLLFRPLGVSAPSWADVTEMSRHFQGVAVPMLAVDRKAGRLLGDPRLASLGRSRRAP